MNLHTADVIINEHRDAVTDYRKFDGVNFSTLSQLAKDPRFVNVEQKDTSYFVFGRYTEDLFMGEDMDSKYAVYPSNLAEPTGQMALYAAHLLSEKLADNPDAELIAYEAAGFKRDSFEKVQERYITEAKDYVEFHLRANGKDVIQPSEALIGNRLSNAFNQHPTIAGFKQEPNRYEINYQVPLVTEVEGVVYKCLVDMLVIDTEENIIYPIDLKTSSKKLQDFSNAARQYRYDMQASLYSFIISKCFPGYNIHNFAFLVGSKETPDVAKMFMVSTADIYYGRFGVTTPTGYTYKGWQELSEEFRKHKDMDFWDLPVEYWENVVPLTIHHEHGK